MGNKSLRNRAGQDCGNVLLEMSFETLRGYRGNLRGINSDMGEETNEDTGSLRGIPGGND